MSTRRCLYTSPCDTFSDLTTDKMRLFPNALDSVQIEVTLRGPVRLGGRSRPGR